MKKPKLRFLGTPEQLRAIVAQTGAVGAWEAMPAGYVRYLCLDGAILNWWPTTRTIDFQGPTGSRERFRRALQRAVYPKAHAQSIDEVKFPRLLVTGSV